MNIYFLVTNLPTIIAFSFANIHPFSHYSRKMAAIFILHGYLSIVFSPFLTYSVLLSSSYASLLLLLFSPLSIIPLSLYLSIFFDHYLSIIVFYPILFFILPFSFYYFIIQSFVYLIILVSFCLSFLPVILSFLCLSYLFLSF